MNIRFLFALPLVAAAIVASPTAPAQTLRDDTYVETVEDSIAKADAAFAQGRFGEAYGYYHWAAIRDDARSQEIAGLMLLMGESMFGKEVHQDREAAAFWLHEAGRRGRAVARQFDLARPLMQTARGDTPALK